MKIFVGSLAVLVLAGGAAAPASAAVTALKCSPDAPVLFPRAPQHVYLLDGKVVSERQFRRVPAEAIESISVVCADELYETFGVQAREAGVVVFTAPGPQSVLRRAIESVTVLQESHLAEHGRFAANLEDLGWTDPTGLIAVTLTVSDDGSRWTASGTHRFLSGKTSSETRASGERPVLGAGD